VCVSSHHHVETFDLLCLEILNDTFSHLAFAGIDEHGLITELYQDRVALPNVDEVDDEVCARKAGDDLRLLAGSHTARGDDAGSECQAEQEP